MAALPFISICIPAYKNAAYLDRLLRSISIQSYKDFEVVITDDSPDNDLLNLITNYQSKFSLQYFRNKPAAGSPANWNRAIAYAKGRWIKIMHDDDWFTDQESLGSFVEAAKKTSCKFIFSGYFSVNIEAGDSHPFILSHFHEKMLDRNALYLFKSNFIGHPSTTFIRNDFKDWFDETIKWVVDFEFYIRLLRREKKFYAIKKPLVNIGMGPDQITRMAFRKKEIELPENLYLLQKFGPVILRNFFVHDYYWRLLRNLDISSVSELKKYTSDPGLAKNFDSMIRLQQKLGINNLKRFGILSKAAMLAHFSLFLLKNN